MDSLERVSHSSSYCGIKLQSTCENDRAITEHNVPTFLCAFLVCILASMKKRGEGHLVEAKWSEEWRDCILIWSLPVTTAPKARGVLAKFLNASSPGCGQQRHHAAHTNGCKARKARGSQYILLYCIINKEHGTTGAEFPVFLMRKSKEDILWSPYTECGGGKFHSMENSTSNWSLSSEGSPRRKPGFRVKIVICSWCYGFCKRQWP